MSSLKLLSTGLAIQIRGSARRGRRASDWRGSSRADELYWFSTAWSRSRIRLARKKDGFVNRPYKRS